MDIAYTGEWTWAASLGRLLLALAFAGGIAATIGYTKAVRNNDEPLAQTGPLGLPLSSHRALCGQRIDVPADLLPPV